MEAGGIDVVVSLRCPACEREMTLEYAGSEKERRRAILEVVEGPRFLGEQFVVPINEELVIGSAEGGWLRFQDGGLDAVHCWIKVDHHGAVMVGDLGSKTGTWIDQLRVVEGVLDPEQHLRLGYYRLRVRHAMVGEAPPEEQKADEGETPEAVPLITMKSIEAEETPVHRLVALRFYLARNGLIILSWLGGMHHFLEMRQWPGQSWIVAALSGIAYTFILSQFAQRIGLTEARTNLAALIVAGLAAVIDAGLFLWFAAAAAALVAGASAVLILKEPKPEHAIGATTLGAAGLAVLAVVTIQKMIEYLPTLQGM